MNATRIVNVYSNATRTVNVYSDYLGLYTHVREVMMFLILPTHTII